MLSDFAKPKKNIHHSFPLQFSNTMQDRESKLLTPHRRVDPVFSRRSWEFNWLKGKVTTDFFVPVILCQSIFYY